MTINIPEWVLWVFGVPFAALAIMFLAIGVATLITLSKWR